MGFISFSGNQAVAGNLTVAGNITATGNISTSLGGVTTQILDINLGGACFKIKQTANGAVGTGTLSSGAATVANTSVAASSMIYLTDTSNGANLGTISVGTITPGTGFTVASSNTLDSDTFSYLIITAG